MIDSGPNTAAAVTTIVKARGERNCCARLGAAIDPCTAAVVDILFAAAGRDVLFPLIEEFEALSRVEQTGDFRTQWNRLQVGAQLLRKLRRRVRGIDITAHRKQLHVTADQLLPALREDVVGPE